MSSFDARDTSIVSDAGLGVGYVAAGLINPMINQRFTFFNQTDSMRQVNELHEQIESLTVVSPV